MKILQHNSNSKSIIWILAFLVSAISFSGCNGQSAFRQNQAVRTELVTSPNRKTYKRYLSFFRLAVPDFCNHIVSGLRSLFVLFSHDRILSVLLDNHTRNLIVSRPIQFRVKIFPFSDKDDFHSFRG